MEHYAISYQRFFNNFNVQSFSKSIKFFPINRQSYDGWRWARAFKLVDKKVGAELVTSFVLEPEDGLGVIDFTPGQYLGIEVTPTGIDCKEIRQYSLSGQPNGKSDRISVKPTLKFPENFQEPALACQLSRRPLN